MTVANADMSGRERQMDYLWCHLDGLTKEERAAVERSLGLIHATDEEEDAALGRAMDAALAEEPDGYVSEETVMATLRDLDAD